MPEAAIADAPVVAAAPVAAPAAVVADAKPAVVVDSKPVEIVYDLKAPEGVDAADVVAFAKAHKLSPEAAQAVLDRDTVSAKAQADKIASMPAVWAEQAKADKEIGGAVFEATVGKAKLALDKFGSPALRQALNDTGLGNHPELIRTFAAIGRAMGEDKLVIAAHGGATTKSDAEIFYGTKA